MKENPEIHSVEKPRPDIEVHLPGDRVLTGPRGTTVGDFFKSIQAELQAPVIAAVVNDELRELTFPIKMDSRLVPITMADADGARIYRRSLTFMLEVAFTARFPQGKLLIDHSISSGGYYCHVSDHPALTAAEIESLEATMQTLVASDLPFERLEMPLAESIAYFQGRNYPEKVRLLSHRKKDYVTLYRMGDHLDYHHGYMVPSTGYLKWFRLFPTEDGFTLRFPLRRSPTELLPIPEYPKLLASFRQYGGWLEKLGIDSVGALNDAIQAGRSREVILVAEALHEQHITEISRQIAERRQQARVILIAGPSSSGKTTFSRRLAIQLLALGLAPFTLELDRFFVDREQTPLDENGQYNFESLDALDLQLFGDHLQSLINGDEVQLPRYNFRTGMREVGDVVQLSPDHIIILEGIHGLNPRLVPGNLANRAFRIYVSALTQLNLDRHNRVSTTDTRLIRRTVRDARERGYAAQQTIRRWESVRWGEEVYIFPYQENADVMFNSALVYELSALGPLAEPVLRQVPHGVPEYIEAKRMLAFLEWFLPLDTNLIPDNSILREFIGGSILHDFNVWKA
ncbi:MAG: nucleoside kinase [Chloroflexota bacterium]